MPLVPPIEPYDPQPLRVGALAVHLLSSQSGFVTGENFIVDGSMTRKMQYA